MEPSKEERCWGREKVLRHAYEKTVGLLGLGLGLLVQVTMTMSEFCLRHWRKAAFAAADVLSAAEVYGVLEISRDGAHLSLPTK